MKAEDFIATQENNDILPTENNNRDNGRNRRGGNNRNNRENNASGSSGKYDTGCGRPHLDMRYQLGRPLAETGLNYRHSQVAFY
mmetsp:Transcript_24829/g.38439  ORF Transcript_24829/g.38439 Transcript_24829/m.38439 type:complete len:84 (-) Transcript_24829:31-282(-)